MSLLSFSNIIFYSTVKAVYDANAFPKVLARVRPLKMRLKEWEDRILANPTTNEATDESHPCVYLRLSHMTLELLLFRAFLRALTLPAEPDVDHSQTYSAILQESQACAEMVVELISRLGSKDFVHFWPPCMLNPEHQSIL